MRKIILLILLLPSIANAYTFGDNWTKENTNLQAAFVAVAVADWGQTLCIANNPDRFYETNPLLGIHPSRGRVNTYFPIVIGLHTAVAVALPPTYRRWWQLIWIGIETGTIMNNASMGIKLDF